MPSLIDILEPLCAQGYLRQVTALCVANKAIAAAAPLGTAKQIYEASRDGRDEALVTYLSYWESNDESWMVLNWASADGLTCLHAAVRHSRLLCVQLLVSARGVNVNFSVEDGLTALHLACRLGLAEILQVLAAVPYADLDTAGGSERDTLLHMAIKGGNVDVVKALLKFRSIVLQLRLRNLQGKSALDLCADCHSKYINEEIVGIISDSLERKARLDAAGRELFHAALYGNMDVLRPLVEQWSGNEYVLDWAVPDGHVLDADDDDPIAETIVTDMTPVIIACYRGHAEATRLLLATPGVNPRYVAKCFGYNIVMYALETGSLEVLRIVLSAVPDIDINHANGNRETACCLAARNSHTECVRELLEQRADIDVNLCVDDNFPLMEAVLSTCVELVVLLLAVPGININYIGTAFALKDCTCLDLALRRGPFRSPVIARLLKAAGAKTFAQLEAESYAGGGDGGEWTHD